MWFFKSKLDNAIDLIIANKDQYRDHKRDYERLKANKERYLHKLATNRVWRKYPKGQEAAKRQSEKSHQKYIANREEILEKIKIRYATDPELRARIKRYNEDHKEKKRETDKIYREKKYKEPEYREERKRLSKEYYQKNKERLSKEALKRYYKRKENNNALNTN